jgi:predicted lactoylglutathione lyase/uncharacterized protein YndB with AHSA1/START domain
MKASPDVLFRAWTVELDRWLAAPGTLLIKAEPDTAFYFETHHGTERHPYYGRILRLERDRLVELTWLSTGTKRAETVITVELTPMSSGTQLRLTHAGFPDEESRTAHEDAWPMFLAQLDGRMAAEGPPGAARAGASAISPTIHCITLPVEDLERSIAFYRDGFGLPVDRSPDHDHVALALPGGLYLVLIQSAEFSKFAELADQVVVPRGASECILSFFAARKNEVDAILERVGAAGGSVVEATEQPWGYAGYFADPDTHLWEILCNPDLEAAEEQTSREKDDRNGC